MSVSYRIVSYRIVSVSYRVLSYHIVAQDPVESDSREEQRDTVTAHYIIMKENDPYFYF